MTDAGDQQQIGQGGYKGVLELHVKLSRGGYIFVRHLVDYPDIFVADRAETRKGPFTRTISWGDWKFKTIEGAVCAFRAAQLGRAA